MKDLIRLLHLQVFTTYLIWSIQMKKSLIATMIAVPVLSLSSLSFAAEPVSLTTAQMDNVTAGTSSWRLNYARVGQINISPVTVVQISALNLGGGSNTAVIQSGNFSTIRQR
jgi:hypothetical protein